MTAPSKSFVPPTDAQIAVDEAVTATTMTQIRDALIHLEEWLGKDFIAEQNHNHNGVNSPLIPIGPNAMRNGSFEVGAGTDEWTVSAYTGGTIEIDTANAMDGLNCLAFTSTVLATGGGEATSNEYIAISGNSAQVVYGLIKASAANISALCEIKWYDASKALISSSTIASYTDTPTSQTEFGAVANAPATARWMRVRIVGGVPASGSAVGTVYFDGIICGKAAPGSLIAFTAITATNAAWTPNAATKRLVVAVVGGGGAGGGVGSGPAINTAAPGGAAGAMKIASTTSINASYAVTIGAGGVGASSAAGGAGGTTSFGALVSASGGAGGSGAATTSTATAVLALTRGEAGPTGIGAAYKTTYGAGTAAGANSGAGGSGARSDEYSSYAGGNGGSGIAFVWEYA